MLAEPLVSFVLINYNYADFVGAALESVLRQDYPHYECVVIDNNSPDNSREVLRQFHGRDERVRFVYLDQNLNQIGALLYILDELKGDYLTIVDSDDLLLSSYASTHVQAHLAIPGGVAFTSSCVIEIDADGQSLTSGYHPFLVRNQGVQLRKLTQDTCSNSKMQENTLLDDIWILAPELQRWHWSPGTANMHNLPLVRATRPHTDDAAYVGATDNYFMWLNHAIAGSARIDRPLSAYRHHGRNRYGAMPSIDGLQIGTRAGVNRSAVRRRDITRELVSRPAAFKHLAPGHFWRLMDAPAAVHTASLTEYYTNRQVTKLLEENLYHLMTAFGETAVREELTARMGARNYHMLARRARSRISRTPQDVV
jgi:glycosyltransferase involved in cell wall biosynthesis